MKLLTTADKVLIVASMFLVVSSLVFIGTFTMQGSIVLIQVDGRTVHKSLLSERDSISVRGEHGQLRVQIQGGKVAIVQADCPNHICVRTGWRSRTGEVIVCVPNKTVVRIVAGEHGKVRATTG